MATEFVLTEQTPPDTGLHCIISIDGHGSLNKLLLITAYVNHFRDNLRAQPLQRNFNRRTFSGSNMQNSQITGRKSATFNS